MTNPSSDAASSPAGDAGARPTAPPGADASTHRTASAHGSAHAPSPDRMADPADTFDQTHLALELAKEWVRQHQTAAMIGAFAVGAFVGALMRD